jgi:dTDP-4-dehydrorhamnose reductase
MNFKTILITGAAGFVGGHILRSALADWHVIGVGRSSTPMAHPRLTWLQTDLLNVESFSSVLAIYRPAAVIHAAALSDIDACEQNPKMAIALNVTVTERLVDFCREYGSKMIFTSTDTVFDGSKSFYSETDLPQPLNLYGRTKVQAEQLVLTRDSSYVVARLSLVAGLPAFARGNSSMARAHKALCSGEPIGVPDDEFRTPVFVSVVCQALIELAGSKESGVFHIAGNDRLSRYEIVRRLAVQLGVDPDLVQIKNSPELGGRAPRPKDVSLANSKVRSRLQTIFPDFDQALAHMLKTEI